MKKGKRIKKKKRGMVGKERLFCLLKKPKIGPWNAFKIDGTIYTKLCENTMNYKYTFPGSNKVVYGACE